MRFFIPFSQRNTMPSANHVICSALATLALVAGAGAAHANAKDNPAAKELANKNGCMSCHDMGTKIIGPSFVQIAEKYRGQADAKVTLVKKIKEGGKGVWGRVPMPPHEQLKDADAALMVGWILAQ